MDNHQPIASSENDVFTLALRCMTPILLALLAAVLNIVVVKAQIRTTPALAATANLGPGEWLTKQHVRVVYVAGDFNKQVLVAPHEILAQLPDSLESAKGRTDMIILSHSVARDELLTNAALGRTSDRAVRLASRTDPSTAQSRSRTRQRAATWSNDFLVDPQEE